MSHNWSHWIWLLVEKLLPVHPPNFPTNMVAIYELLTKAGDSVTLEGRNESKQHSTHTRNFPCTVTYKGLNWKLQAKCWWGMSSLPSMSPGGTVTDLHRDLAPQVLAESLQGARRLWAWYHLLLGQGGEARHKQMPIFICAVSKVSENLQPWSAYWKEHMILLLTSKKMIETLLWGWFQSLHIYHPRRTLASARRQKYMPMVPHDGVT
jgi:hypothetical protein